MATKTKTKENGAGPIEVTLDTRQQVRLRNRDLIDFQKVTGVSLIKWGAEIERKMRAAGDDKDAQTEAMGEMDWEAMTALLWIIGRRDNPGFTWDDALDADVDQDSLMSLYGMIADPTAPAAPTAAT